MPRVDADRSKSALTQEFREKALLLLKQFTAAGTPVGNQKRTYHFRDFGALRMAAIPEIRGNLEEFLAGRIDFKTFKTNNELLCRKHDYWGMKAYSGQGFLNLLSKFATDPDRIAAAFRVALSYPRSDAECVQKIDELKKTLPTIVPRKGLPLASIPPLLSYFWQMQDPDHMPIFYTSARAVLTENGYAAADLSNGQAFLEYRQINDQLFDLFSKTMDLNGVNRYWFVEHVLWLAYKPESQGEKIVDKPQPARTSLPREQRGDFQQWIPPILSDFEALAARKEGDSLEFERAVIKAFKMLGFQVDGIGQGKGREPDGVAKWSPGGFAVLIDAKSSTNGYSIGTGDRAIIEYIDRYEPVLRKEGIRKIYFVLVSSTFVGTSEKPIHNIRKDSPAKAVVLLTATQLLRILAKRIQEPYAFDLESLESLFLNSGLISDETLADFLASY